MINQGVVAEASRLNQLLMMKPWLDIEVIERSAHSAVLHCGIDLTAAPDLTRFSSYPF
jgi:hypothetical protein